MKPHRTKSIAKIVIASLVLVGALVAYGQLRTTPEAPEATPETAQTTTPTPKPDPIPTLTFSATGDLLAHDTINQQAKTADGYDFKPYYAQVHDLMAADVVFCNPETLVSGADFKISGYPSFNAPTEFARDAVEAGGCNLINLASNHIGDRGVNALNATLNVWDKLPILAKSGANRNAEEQNQVSYFTKNGIKVAFLAFADYSNVKFGAPHLNLYRNQPLFNNLATTARQNADVVIVSMHWGTEDSATVNQDQLNYAKLLNNLGVDVIIGTGPHVLQKVDWLTNPDGHRTLVWYSLGNLLSSQLYHNQLTGGVAKFTITKKDGSVTVTEPSFTATFMSYDWPAADRAANRLLARHNLELLPLANAEAQTTKMGTSLANRTDFVRRTIGDQVKVTP